MSQVQDQKPDFTRHQMLATQANIKQKFEKLNELDRNTQFFGIKNQKHSDYRSTVKNSTLPTLAAPGSIQAETAMAQYATKKELSKDAGSRVSDYDQVQVGGMRIRDKEGTSIVSSGMNSGQRNRKVVYGGPSTQYPSPLQSWGTNHRQDMDIAQSLFRTSRDFQKNKDLLSIKEETPTKKRRPFDQLSVKKDGTLLIEEVKINEETTKSPNKDVDVASGFLQNSTSDKVHVFDARYGSTKTSRFDR